MEIKSPIQIASGSVQPASSSNSRKEQEKQRQNQNKKQAETKNNIPGTTPEKTAQQDSEIPAVPLSSESWIELQNQPSKNPKNDAAPIRLFSQPPCVKVKKINSQY